MPAVGCPSAARKSPRQRRGRRPDVHITRETTDSLGLTALANNPAAKWKKKPTYPEPEAEARARQSTKSEVTSSRWPADQRCDADSSFPIRNGRNRA